MWEKLQDKFNPRPPDDDEPQDWWFASTAVPLIAATTSPFANVMSVVALAMSWKSEIHPEQQDPEGNPVQVLLADPRWYNPVFPSSDVTQANCVQVHWSERHLSCFWGARESFPFVQLHPDYPVYYRPPCFYYSLVLSDRHCKCQDHKSHRLWLTRTVGRNHQLSAYLC